MSGIRALMAVSAVLAILTIGLGPASASPGTFTWEMACKGGGFAIVTWNWTQAGSSILGAGGSAGCSGGATLSGTGERPAAADGFTAELSILSCATGSPACGYDADRVTDSFDPAQSYHVRLGVSVGGTAADPFCEFRHCDKIHIDSGNAHFHLES